MDEPIKTSDTIQRRSRLSVIDFQCVVAPRARIAMIAGGIISILSTVVLYFFFRQVPAYEILEHALPPYVRGVAEWSSQRISSNYGSDAAEFYKDMFCVHFFIGISTLLWFALELLLEYKSNGLKNYKLATIVEPGNGALHILILGHMFVFCLVYLTNFMKLAGPGFDSPGPILYFMMVGSASLSPYTVFYSILILSLRRIR